MLHFASLLSQIGVVLFMFVVEKHSKGLLAGILAFVLACAWITESIGW